MDAKYVTWLGEDDAHFTLEANEKGQLEKNQAPGPSFTTWGYGDHKKRFDKGKPVKIDPDAAKDATEKSILEQILKKAPNSAYFKVSDTDKVEKPIENGDDEDDDDDDVKGALPRLKSKVRR